MLNNLEKLKDSSVSLNPLLCIKDPKIKVEIKEALKSIGVETERIILTQTIDQALKKINDQNSSFNLIIINNEIDNKSFKEVIGFLNEKENSHLTSTIIIESIKNPIDHTHSLDKDNIDYIPSPFTKEKFDKCFNHCLNRSIHRTKNSEMYKTYYKYQASNELLEKLQELNHSDCNDYNFFIAKAYENQNKYSQAIERYQKHLSLNNEHYACLKSLYLLKLKVKDLADIEKLYANLLKYPLDIFLAPMIAKMMIVNEQFDHCLNLYQKSLRREFIREIIDLNPSRKKDIFEAIFKLSITLITASKILDSKGETNQSISFLEHAFYFSLDHQIKIKAHSLSELMKKGEINSVKKLIKAIPEEYQNYDEIEVIKLILDKEILPPEKILLTSLTMIKRGVKDMRVYDVIIDKSFVLKRKSGFIREMIDEAVKVFPDKEKYFNRYYKRL